MALGEWIDDPKLLVCSHEGYRWQWQALPGQQPQWVPVSKVRPVPQVDAMAWDAGPQRPTVVLPLAAQPKASVAFCPPKAGPPQPEPPGARLAQMAQPEPKPEPKQDPAPPPGPPPQQQQPPVQHGPGPTEGHNFVAALGEWQRQETALREQQSALQQQARALQEAVLQQLREDVLRPQQQQQPQPMPEQHAGMQDQQPMAMPEGAGVHNAIAHGAGSAASVAPGSGCSQCHCCCTEWQCCCVQWHCSQWHCWCSQRQCCCRQWHGAPCSSTEYKELPMELPREAQCHERGTVQGKGVLRGQR